jgi:hypothetical protein
VPRSVELRARALSLILRRISSWLSAVQGGR